jgi:spore coat protein CotH
LLSTAYPPPKFAYNLFSKAGVYAPYACNVHLILNIDGNKLNMGVYSLIENVDAKFINKRFTKKANDGNLYKCLYRHDIYANLDLASIVSVGIKNPAENSYPTYDMVTNENENDGSDLVQFITNLDKLSGYDLKSYLDGKIDIGNFMKFNAISYLLGSIDDFRYRGNNYYIYFNSKNYQIYFIPQDLDYVLGQYGDLTYYQAEFAAIDVYSTWTLMGQKNTLLAKTLLLVEDSNFNDYRSIYEDYIKLYSSVFFSYDNYQEYYNRTKDFYSEYVLTDKVRTTTPPFGLTMVVEDFFKTKLKTVSEVIG